MTIGAAVTYLATGPQGARPLLVHARWGRNHRSRYEGLDTIPDVYELRRNSAGGNVHLAYVALADEGRTWCRGHVREDEEAGAALLAYSALAAGAA